MTTIELAPQQVLTPQDHVLAETIGLRPDDLAELTLTRIHEIGSVAILDTNEVAPVMRFHTGPDDGAIFRGGTKFKGYANRETQTADGVDHSQSMFYKIGGIGGAAERDVAPMGYAGGKTIAAIDYRKWQLSEKQTSDAMRQVARLMHDAGFTNPRIDGTAGDEGTNQIIWHYVDELRRLGHPHPETAITGKSDMRIRPAATGRGAAIAHRARMVLLNEYGTRSATQGAGAAGVHYVAEAYDPYDGDDRKQHIAVSALGDIRRAEDGSIIPVTLHTDHPEGLAITREMAEAVLAPDALTTDPDLIATKGNRLYALARKLEAAGQNVTISDKDVLYYPDAEYLVPAATSNVIHAGNIGSLPIKNILEIGNHVVHDNAQTALAELGFTLVPGEVVNAGGVAVSIEENLRDLRKIASQERGVAYEPVSDESYQERLHTTMTAATRRVHAVADRLGINLRDAASAVGLANFAISRKMQIGTEIRDLLV